MRGWIDERTGPWGQTKPCCRGVREGIGGVKTPVRVVLALYPASAWCFTGLS